LALLSSETESFKTFGRRDGAIYRFVSSLFMRIGLGWS
jgi:hypothetical protein